jgi:hypothetical protein
MHYPGNGTSRQILQPTCNCSTTRSPTTSTSLPVPFVKRSNRLHHYGRSLHRLDFMFLYTYVLGHLCALLPPHFFSDMSVRCDSRFQKVFEVLEPM